MNYKNVLYTAIITISFISFNCSNDDANTPTPKYTTTNDLAIDIDSLHLKMTNLTRQDNYFIAGWAGDDITTFYGSGKADFREMDTRFHSNTNARTAKVWRDSYAIINTINNILADASKLDNTDTSKDYMVGEAYFLRGILYHHLLRLFGQLPLQLGTEIDTTIPISSATQVYTQIESDLLNATQLLPIIYPNVNPGAPRPNKGSAKAFLSRVYLDWAGYPVKDNSKYALSASMAKDVIDNHNAHGFDLVEDLDDLWTVEHRFNTESIYTVVHCKSCEQAGNFKYGKLGVPTEYGGWGETLAEIKFFETFPENHRKDATYITDFELNDPFSNPPGGPTVNWVNFPSQKTPLFAKIIGKGDFSRETHTTERNDYMMRYAEVLLTFAEASARSGNSSAEAWEALNKIRRRAELLPPNTPDANVDITSGDLAELAFAERGWELAGEFLRWFDLVRTERVSQFLNPTYRNDINSEVTDTNHPDYGNPIIIYNPIIGSLETDNYFVALNDYQTWYFPE